MIITRHIFILLLTLSSFALSSCNRDELGREIQLYTGERIPLDVQFFAGRAAADDNTIESVHIVVFNDKNELVYNDATVPEVGTSSDNYTATVEAAPGSNNFYIFCNSPKELSDKLKALTDEVQIESLTFANKGFAPPLPMFSKVMRAYVYVDRDKLRITTPVDNITRDHLPVQVTRMMSRISFTAIKKITAPTDDFVVEELKIRVCHMPAYTTVGTGVAYDGPNWLNDITATGIGQLDSDNEYTYDASGMGTPDPSKDVITFPEIYIPEYTLKVAADRSKATYLTIDATCKMKNGTTQVLHSTYQVCIGHEPTVNYNLKRNNHYRIFATITDIGAMGIYAEIQPMDNYEMAINWKPVDGLVIVSDKSSDFDETAGISRNVNIWNDYTVYSGILKTYHSDKGYNDITFKYGSLIGVRTEPTNSETSDHFKAPTSVDNLGDILWYPSSYGNPFDKVTTWANIPYISSGNIPIDNNRVADAVGDPCKLVGLSAEQIAANIKDNMQWHMATPEEYNILIRAKNSISPYGYNAFNYLTIPYSKIYGTDGGIDLMKPSAGAYWTTEGSTAFTFPMITGASGQLPVSDPSNGFSVRCVRNVIPDTFMYVGASPSFNYQGNITTGSLFKISSNIPYWTATLIVDPDDPEIGTSRDFEDFSFTPGGTTSVKTISGAFSQSIPVYLSRKEDTKSRTFRIRVTGIGFDGVEKTVNITVIQSGYTIEGIPTFTPAIDDKANWIPQAGQVLKVTITLTPNDIQMPNGYLSIVASYHGTVINQSQSVPISSPTKYVYADEFDITIPPNNTPDPIGIEFTIHYGSNPTNPLSNQKIGRYYALQKIN